MTNNRENYTELQKSFIDVFHDEYCDNCIKSRTNANFDEFSHIIGLKKKVLLDILKNDPELRIILSTRSKETNQQIFNLKKMSFALKAPKIINKEDIPQNYREDHRFLDLMREWNRGNRNKSELSRTIGVSRETIYKWLRLVGQTD